MTEKRFTELTSSIDYYTIWDNKEDKGLTVEDAVDLLNELDEKYVDEFSLRETLQQELQRVENENEELKHECNYLQNRLDDFINIQNENEELKKELESFKPIIFESDGKPVTLYKKGDVE